WLAASCAPAPPVSAPAAEAPSVVIASAPVPVASATATATATAPAAPAPRGRRFVSTSRPLFDDIDADTGPAPCDFARTYRGTIGDVHLTILLAAPAPDKLGGLAHYDRPGPAIAVTGARRGALDFTLQESGGGRFEGRCDDKGALQGTYTLGGRTRPF